MVETDIQVISKWFAVLRPVNKNGYIRATDRRVIDREVETDRQTGREK